MAKIYFNQGIIKPTKDPTVLNYFVESGNRKTIYVRDTSSNVYIGETTLLEGGINFYMKDGNYHVDITSERGIEIGVKNYGIFLGEGKEFDIKATKDPIFTVRQNSTEFSTSSNYFMQDIVPEQTLMGMFFSGTEITYKRQGHHVKDILTDNGWKRVYGPPDSKLGIISMSEAHHVLTKERETIKSTGTSKKIEESKYRLKQAIEEGSGNVPVMKSLMESYDAEPSSLYLFVASDLKDLKKRDILV